MKELQCNKVKRHAELKEVEERGPKLQIKHRVSKKDKGINRNRSW